MLRRLSSRTLGALLGGGIFLFLLVVSWLGVGQRLVWREFDLLTVLAAPGTQQLPIIVVGIDDASFQVMGERWPWPRSRHAQLIRTLKDGGAAVIAFDVLFDQPSDPAEDAAMAEAIAYAGNVVLAKGLTRQETAAGTLWVDYLPLPEFQAAGAILGRINIEPDSDLHVRRPPEWGDAFSRVIAETVARNIPGLGVDAQIRPGQMIRYYGPELTFANVSFYQALDPEQYLQGRPFEDAVVLVGRIGEATSDVGAAQTDMFFSPFTTFSSALMPGVEIHANLIEAALTGGPRIQRAGPLLENGLLLAAVLLMTLAGVRLSIARAGGVALLAMLLLAGAGWLLFSQRLFWLPVLPSLLALLWIFLGQAFVAYWQEHQRRMQIRNMFALYVPEKVVADLADDPDGLQLGGAQREITILFCDLAGFTSISERLKPTEVAAMLNEYFREMTEVIFRHGGTVDKFIGDAIMAFWGAPVEDAEQALHATRAAIEMCSTLERLNLRLAEMGLGAISMRVGINSGSAVVGNLGSPTRFSYTAIGDSVNLASRLEGVNKLYGTLILVSESTAGQITGQVGLRLVDRVQVKGKQTAVAIYTPCDDAAICDWSLAALEHYRHRHWDEAQAALDAIAAQLPQDPVVAVLRARIDGLRTAPPEPGWDGEYVLDSK